MSRPLRPNVVTVGDNPVAKVKCEPDRDEVNVDALLNEIMVRFEFGLGTSFDLQFTTMDGNRLLAMRRFVVVVAFEDIVTSNVNFEQTMTKTVQRRMCMPISDWYIFDPVAEILRHDEGVIEDDNDIDLDKANPTALQQFIKSKRGKGFPPGTSRADMIEEAKKYL